MQQINERTSGYLTVTFLNKTGQAEAPTTANYKIVDAWTSTSVRATTSLASIATVEIHLSAEDTRILNEKNVTEVRKVTINAYYGNGDELHGEYQYEVVNLHGVTTP